MRQWILNLWSLACYEIIACIISLACLETGPSSPLRSSLSTTDNLLIIYTRRVSLAVCSPLRKRKYWCFLSPTILSLCYTSCFKWGLFSTACCFRDNLLIWNHDVFLLNHSRRSCFLFLKRETANRNGRLAKTKPPFLCEAASLLLSEGMITWRYNLPLNGLISWKNTRYIEFELC